MSPVPDNLFNKVTFQLAEGEYLIDLMKRGNAADAAHVARRMASKLQSIADRLEGVSKPPEAFRPPVVTVEADADLMIYTDGTNLGRVVSSAFVVIDAKTLRPVHKFAQAEPSMDLNDSEHVAVFRAVEYLRTTSGKRVIIVTDSSDVLHSVFKKRISGNLESGIRGILQAMYAASPFSLRMIEDAERPFNHIAHKLCRQASRDHIATASQAPVAFCIHGIRLVGNEVCPTCWAATQDGGHPTLS